MNPLDEQVKACDNNAVKLVKKKKKKKKKSSITFVPFELENVRAECSRKKGRHLIANTDIAAGELVFSEVPYSFILRSKCQKQFCTSCLKECSDSSLGCLECSGASYCSSECQEQDTSLHSLCCALFIHLPRISYQNDCDADLLRLAFRIACSASLGEGSRPDRHHYEDVLSLMHSYESFPSDWRKCVTQSVELCWEYLPDSVKEFPNVSVEEIVRICCRINVNAHGMRASNARNTDIGLGLFCVNPFANHSCEPNCLFINDGKVMKTIAVRDIQKDEEINISYIDTFEVRESRIQELIRTKFFACKCKRCTEPIDVSIDRYLEGILCSEKKCNMSVLLSTDDDQFQCETCQGMVSTQDVSTRISHLLALQQSAALLRNQGDRQGERKLLEKFIAESKTLYHPLHVSLMDVRVRLMNCYDSLELYSQSAFTVVQIISCLEEVMPPLCVETSNFLFHLGSTYSQMLESGETTSSALEASLRNRCRAAFEKCLSIRSRLFGDSHPFTTMVSSKLSSV